MTEVLQERIFIHRKYHGKNPSKLAVTPVQRVALLNEIGCLGCMTENPQDLKEELFMGIPLEVIYDEE